MKMQLSLLIASLLVTLVLAEPASPRPNLEDRSTPKDKPELYLNKDADELFQYFKELYDKKYESKQEERHRRNIFKRNLKEIRNNNYLFSKGLSTFTMGINQFSDMEPSEVVHNSTGYLPSNVSRELLPSNFIQVETNAKLPLQVDWRDNGYVTPVQDQGNCGSCWAFSAIAALEGQHFKKTGNLVKLSEQQPLDCSNEFGNMGCVGGLMSLAFNYMDSNEGVDTADSYPYSGTQGPVCLYNPATVGATCKGYRTITPSESALMAAVASVGPISVAIDGSPLSFQSYTSGVYDDAACSSTMLNHAVTIVGYGTSSAGQEYWIAKNSWGVSWGMNGYIFMSRNKNNQCGVATDATYPVV